MLTIDTLAVHFLTSGFSSARWLVSYLVVAGWAVPPVDCFMGLASLSSPGSSGDTADCAASTCLSLNLGGGTPGSGAHLEWCGRHLARSPIIRLRNFICLLRFMRSQDVVDAAADAFLSPWQRLQPFDDVFTQQDCYLSFRGLGLGSPSDIFPVQGHGYVGRVYFSVRHPSEFFQFFPLLFSKPSVAFLHTNLFRRLLFFWR